MLRVRIRPDVSILCPRCLFWSVLLGFCLTGTAVAQTGDNRSYCKGDGRVALFLVDVTTPYDQTDKDLIVKATDKILASLAGGEKVIVRAVNSWSSGASRFVRQRG
jgi:hypothetical protein